MDILVPIDDSETARAALEHAVDRYPEATITVLHVIDPSVSKYGNGGIYAYESILETRKDAAAELFDDVTTLVAAHEGEVITETVVGSPAREIVTYADDHGSDHIVMGSRGRSGASRVLLGSVAERVVRRSPVPVTIVR
ncbi:universal stress protein [Natronorubrum sulfidifaciens]|uniref:UspA domain-containing protein n=1 Tax=Natronorubrum sulfidifaciens JCM 14089 TaxID=1230460 RepID=L9W5W2_9EURY|nr:universal stress protein [Natronorubrum sulfidifaciens]ELY43718.1 UspA domain-containing protein [Natronorubrum sulfidifaciens JCM 14089]